jgi:DNA-directed RNA polymerase specialized sigma24 family protein
MRESHLSRCTERTPISDESSEQVQVWLGLLNAGDRSAEGPLLQFIGTRWRVFARRALHGSHRRLEPVEETEGLLSELALRVLQDWRRGALPATAAEFFRQTANNFGNVLVDLCRKHYGRENHRRPPASLQAGDEAGVRFDPGTETLDPARLALWGEFHKQVNALPDALRAVFQLRWYHDLGQEETARTLGIAPRTVSLRWVEARLRLRAALGGHPFEDLGE